MNSHDNTWLVLLAAKLEVGGGIWKFLKPRVFFFGGIIVDIPIWMYSP